VEPTNQKTGQLGQVWINQKTGKLGQVLELLEKGIERSGLD